MKISDGYNTATGCNVAATGCDEAATRCDEVATGCDKVATGCDKVATRLRRGATRLRRGCRPATVAAPSHPQAEDFILRFHFFRTQGLCGPQRPHPQTYGNVGAPSAHPHPHPHPHCDEGATWMEAPFRTSASVLRSPHIRIRIRTLWRRDFCAVRTCGCADLRMRTSMEA